MAPHECYMAMLEIDDHLQALNIEERQVTVEPMEALEDVSFDDKHPNWTTRIGMQSSFLVHKELTLFLRNDLNFFSWSHEDMPGIDCSTLVHQLNVSLPFPPVRQMKRVFTQEIDKTIAKEVHKLLEAGFIKEVYYPEWLANIVMVKKAHGKWRICVEFTKLNKACRKIVTHFHRLTSS